MKTKPQTIEEMFEMVTELPLSASKLVILWMKDKLSRDNNQLTINN